MGAMKGPWKWTLLALLLVSTPILKADQTQSECTSDAECLLRNLERAKRSSDLQVEVNGDQTTTYYLKTDSVGRPRPLGLITSTEGAFVNDGTTTQYTTQILGMSLHGTYAKIVSTSQRVFSTIPVKTDVPEYHPTGLMSSVVDTKVNEGTTTLQTTEVYRTFVGSLYAQEIVTRSEVIKPTSVVAESEIQATATVQSSIVTEIPSEQSTSGSVVFQKSYLTQIVGQRVIPSVSVQREDDWATEDSNKLLDSFTEDNLLRARKADLDGAVIVDNIEPSKPTIALPTFRAGRRLDEIFADEDAQKSTTSTTTTTTTEKQPEIVVRTEQRIESHEVKGDSVVVKIVHQDVPVVPIPVPTAVEEDPTKPTTVTYEGFAAFTTQVGNTHIVFKPSLGLNPITALPRPSLEASTVVVPSAEPTVSSHVTMEPIVSVEMSTEAPVVVTSDVSSSESVVMKEEKEQAPTPEPAVLQEPEVPLKMNALMSNKPLEVMATALEESQEPARKARISVGDNPWVVFATNSPVEAEAPTARQIGGDSSTVVADVETASESVKESVAETSTRVVAPDTSAPTPIIAMATEQVETPVVPSPMQSQSVSVFSAVTEEKIAAPEVAVKEEAAVTMGSEDPETETEASTEPNVMPAVIMPSMVEPEEMTMSGTAFTTYTYFTTFFDDRTTRVITREEVVTNVLKTESPDADAFDSGHQARGIFSSVDSGMMKTFFTTYTYFTTLSVGDQTVVSSRTEVYSNVVMAAGEHMDDSVMAEFGLVPESESASNESSSTITTTNVVPSSVRQLETSVWAGKVMEPHTESDESMNHPVAQAAPAMLDAPSSANLESSMTQAEPTAKTLFTTFTYFTTFFNEGTSTVTSKEETVTNVVTEGGETSALTATEAIFPVTYYTTYTYWTTSTSEGQVVVTSREETQSRVVIPTETEASGTGVSETTEEPVVASTMVPTLTTFYTTFTYFTTSFDGETPVVSSSFETVTNVVDGLSSAAEQSSARAVGEGATSNAIHEPMGLLSSLTTVEVNNGITTTFSTDVIGTFINGLYATILESTSSVIAADMSPTLALPQTTSRFPVGLVSVNMGTAYDIDDPTTTYFTSKAFGTYIGDLYAQVIESTTSLSIDEVKTVPATVDEFRTGLVRSIEGSIVKDSVTTVYASQIVGTVIDGLYAQVIQSTSTFIEATPVAVVVETNTVAAPTSEVPISDNSVLPQPATTPLTLEGSISNEVTTPSAEENDATPTAESKLLGGKLKFPSRPSPVSRSRPAFSPSFRPVNTQRPRPGLPIKKTKPSSSSADIEPSPVSTSSFSATRATSSRFSSSSLRSSATATPSSNRLFRLTRPASSGFVASSSSSFGSTLSPRRSSSAVNPTTAGSSSFRRFSSSSEGAGSSRLRSSSALPVASSRSSAGVGGLTRLHQRVSSSVPKIQPTPVVEEKITSLEVPAEEANPEDLQDISEEPQEVTVPTRQPGRLPLRPVTPRPAPLTTTNSRRQFPFRRPQLPTTSAPVSTPDSDNGITGGPTTAKPRFVRPPKITVTARPRPTLSPLNRRLVKRPGQFDGEEDIDTQASSLLRRRTKREDPFYTRQQRTPVRRRQVFEQSRRPSSTKSSRTRAATWEDPAAFDYLDYDASEEAPATSKPRFAGRQTTSSFRSRAPATTQAPVRSRPSRPRLTPTGARQSEFTLTNRQPTTSQRFRKPETTSTRSSFRRPETTTSSRTRTRVNSQSVTTEEPRASTGRRFNSNPRRPSSSSTRIRDNEFEEVPPTRQREPVDAAPALITPLTVTHRVPSETTIPVVKNGATEFRTVITAMPSLQVLPTYSSTKIAGSWRYLASELSSIKAPGMTEVTQYFIKPSDTSVVEFTPTTIRGRHTSFSHVIPSTVYEVETSVTTIQDPVAATNNLLQQLLLGNLGANPLLGVPGAPATPVTQFTTHTSTYVTTLTDALSTILPITLRGKEVRTTIVHSTTSVVTLTEMSTETNIITPAVPFVSQANPLASLLPVLLQNQLLQGQLGLQPTPALQAQPIQPTVAPQIHEEEKDFRVTESPRKSTRQQQNFHPEEEEDHHDEIIQPAKAQPVTSVVTLYLSGRRPGEFSSVLSTVTLDGSEASVVKRHSPQSAAPIEASALPFAIGTDRGLFELPDGYKEEDLEYYLVSAMNEIGAEEIYDTAEAQHLQYVLTHAQPTPELNGDYGKKLQGKSRKARQALDSAEDDSELLSSLVEDDWAKIVPASQSQPVEEVQKQPEPVVPSKVRKTKTVIVTRKIRPTAGAPEVTPSEALLEELGITNTRRRKVVVVTRRVKSSKSAVDPLIEPTFAFQEVSGNDLTSPVVQEPAVSEPVVDPTPVTSASREGRRLVTVTRKRPVSASDVPEPQLRASTTPQQASATTPKSAPQLDGSLGDVYAPRTYYTIYSYLYTVLNTGVDKPVSSRVVTVSEIVRGKDGRLPSTFSRTENNNGLYTIAAGNGFSDLGTRVSLGETLHVNLASAILVKYGRGAIRAHQSELKPLDSTSATQTRPRVRPTPVEPSFTSPVEENNVDSSSVATQSLPTRSRTTITRTIARTQARSTAAASAKQSEPASTATTRVASPQRQRGTVRFGGSSGSVSRSAAVPQVATTTSRTFIRRPTLTSSRSTTSVSRFIQPSRVVANSVEDDYQEQEFDHDYQDNPEHFDDYHEYDEDLTHGEDREHSVEDIPQYDEEYPEHEDDYPVDEEHFNESEEPIQDDASFETSLAPSSTATVTPAASSFTVSSTRSRVNPLEKHLSSIRAAARFSSGVSSSSLLPFRSRLAQRLSASSSISGSIEPSHVYYHKFATTSTLLVDGGRDPVLVTLMTSTLTTLGDSQLSMVTESPQAFMPVTSTSSTPLLRSSSRLSLFSTRVASSRNSPSSSASLTVVPTLSTLTTVLAPSTEAVEASFVTTEASVEESTEPITTPVPESVETTPFSVEGEEEMKQEPEAVVPAIANPTTTTVFSTVVETELRTFTAVVTRKSNDEEIVTTHFETVPEVVTKTVTVVQTLDAPTARFVGNAGASAQIIDPSPKAGLRGGRLSIDANARLPLATKVMSNGVEVIVAGERKNTLLAHEVVQGTQVLEASSPFTLPPTAISNAMLVDSEVLNQGLLSSIQFATAEFITQTYLTTFTYLTTLLEGDSSVVSSRHEIISNIVTREPGHFLTTPVPDLTLTSGFISPSYSTYTYLTTYTYFNTFLDNSRPVVLKSKETVSNIVTIPADSANKMIQSSALFDTQTYLRTYTFSKTLKDSVHTTEEVITQVVVTEAPIQTQVPVQPTPTVSSELTKTYLTTVTYLTTEVEGTDTVIRQDTVVSSEVVTETIFSEVEATPTLSLPGVSAQPELEASLPLLPQAEDSDGPIFATKTYFTTSTYYTTMLEDESTIIKSRTEVTSSVATERLPQGLGALLMSTAPVFVLPSDTRTTYLSLGDNVYGQLRTILATATYYITDAQGSVATKQLVIPQVSTSTITTSVLPSDAVIQPSSSILSSASLASIKASFLASSAAPASILSADQLQSIKSSFVLSSTPTLGPEEADVADTTTAQLPTEDGNTLLEEPNLGGALVGATPQLNLPFPPPQVGTAVVTSPTTVTGLDGSVSSVTSGATVVMVTDAAGGVAVLPTEVLTSGTTLVGTIVNQKPSLWNLGTLGTVGLAALSQGLAGNSLGGLNINLGPVIDSMTGLISNAFLTRRNDSIARTQSRIPAETPVQQQDPIFIPVGSIGASQNDREDVVARQPTFIPLRRPEPPTPRPPAPAVPLQPKTGSPLFKPGTDPRPLVHFPGQPADSPRPGSFRSPGIETGFSAIQPTTRATVITGAETVFLGRPNLSLQRPNVVNFENHQGPVNPSRPIIFQGATTQFFDPNGQPFPDRNPVRFPAPIAPPNQPILGNLVPGPDGKPVRIVAVPEGVNPPPGASGQVFVRPAAPAVQPALEPVPAVQPAQQTPALPAARPGSAPIRPLPMLEFDLPRPASPSVQTIVSIEGDNKIVGTRIVSQGQTVLIQPTQPAPRPVEPLPTAAVIPSSVAVAVPSVITEEPKVPVVVDSVEVSTEPVEQPSLEASVPEVSLPEVPAVPETSPVPEVPVKEEVSVASEQPEAPSSVQLLPSFAPEVVTTSSHVFPDIASWTTPTPVATRVNEPDGITKVILGANNQLTTFVTRIETSATHAHTLLSTIVDGHTQVNAVQPTVVADQSTEAAHKAPNTLGSTMAETVSIAQSTQEATQTPSMEEKSTTATTTTTTTQPPIRLGGIFGLGSNEAGTTTTTEESIADKVLDESINSVLLSGPQRTQVSVNHKPVEVAKCNPQCKDFEICQSRGSAPPTCVCRPGYARSDATQPCTKAFTYQVRLALENAKQPSRSNFTWMADPSAPEYHQMTQVLRTGIQDTLGRADLWDAYRNADVMAVKPMEGSVDSHALAEFVVQLGSQYDEQQLKSSLQKALENNQYRLGEDVMVAARVSDGLVVQDFDECTGGTHDCPESSVCVNNHGSYECRCKPGMQDAIDGSGRLCVSASQELGDCELCNRQGRCDTTPAGETVCVCNYWFAGDKCQFNLKVLMIALVSLGVLLILLTFGCIIVCCIRNRRASSTISPAAPAFLRYRGGMMPPTGTMDRTAMIRGDTSSESSVGLGVSGIDNMAGTLEGRGKGNGGASLQSYRHYGEGEDKVPVIIPRVRTHRDQPSVQNEQQMLSYLEQGRTGQGRLRASTDNMASVGARSNSTFTTLRGPESSDGPNLTSTPNMTNANPPDDIDSTMNEARSYDETTVRPAVRHLHSSTSSVNRTQSHGGKQYFQHEDARSPGVRGQGRPSLRLAFPRPNLYTSFRDSEGSNFDSL